MVERQIVVGLASCGCDAASAGHIPFGRYGPARLAAGDDDGLTLFSHERLSLSSAGRVSPGCLLRGRGVVEDVREGLAHFDSTSRPQAAAAFLRVPCFASMASPAGCITVTIPTGAPNSVVPIITPT